MKPKLPLVSFEVTMSCNLRCRFCYNHHKNGVGELLPPPSSYRLARKSLKKIFGTFDVGQITFTGGEPFMGERFSELVLTARFHGAKVGIISNGNFAAPDQYLQLTKLGVTLFELPVHSNDPKIHDYMTRREGSHNKSLNVIKTLLSAGVTPVAVVVLTKFNADCAADTIRYIASLGIKRIMLNRYNIGGEGVANPEDILPSEQQLKTAFREISDEAIRQHLTILSSVCIPICILDPKDYRGIQFSSCSTDLSKRPVTIDYMGNVRFCNHSPVVLGNLFSNTVEEIWNSPTINQWRNTVPTYCK
ncbi:MAG: radical SAM protein, partial [Bacteroidales bacterium]|nr:radical SAM protein [Bacteroidales bacterium]